MRNSEVEEITSQYVAAHEALGRARAKVLLACARHDARKPNAEETLAAVEATTYDVTEAESLIWKLEGRLLREGRALNDGDVESTEAK